MPTLPAQALTYSLDPGFPFGAAINATNGVSPGHPPKPRAVAAIPVTIRVTDNFSPPATAAETITITVNEVNTLPMLARIGNKTVDEATLLTFTNSATDADLPAQNSDLLPGPRVSHRGKHRSRDWYLYLDTHRSQGPGSYQVTIRVTDNGSPPAAAAEIITITVREVNTPPLLTHIGNKNRYSMHGFRLHRERDGCGSSSPDPGHSLWIPERRWALRIDPPHGLVTWTPKEAQGPGTFQVTIRVTDNGPPPASAMENHHH